MFSEAVVAKAAGALIGSSLALAFNSKGCSWRNMFIQFVVGAVIGFIGAPIARRYLELPPEFDIILACAAGCGVMGWILLKFLLTPNLLHRVFHKHYPDK